MSHDSLRRNQEYMGYGALTGLFRESQVQPPYTYRRDLNRLRQWQQANSESDTIQDEMFKYMSTALNALQHVFIYKLTPKFNVLKSKCKSITNHMDTASLCVIIFALFTLFIILLSRFIVDYEDIKNLSSINNNNIESNIDIIIDHNESTLTQNNFIPPNNDIVVEEYDTIDNLFQPTPIPLVDNINIPQDKNENDDIINDTIFNEWILIHSIDWNDIKSGQVIKIKDIKNNQFATAIIQNIDLSQMNIAIQFTNCWIFCHETIDIITSHRMIYLIENQHKPKDIIKDNSDSHSHSDTDANNNNEFNNNEYDNNDEENEIHFDPTRLYESMDVIKDDHNDFKYWVQSQFTEIQSNNDELKDVLTDYLDEKMNKLLQILENQQHSIQSIIDVREQQNNNNNNNINNSINNAANIDWDWDSIEHRIDNKIESVVKVQLEEKFGNLAQEIGQEIAKEIAQNTNNNAHIGGNSDDILKGDDDRKNNINKQKIDWTYRVVSHSKLKINNDDIFHEYGYWIMHNLLAKWNQQSISTTSKPGDCTPLQFNKHNNKQSHSYITIELYRAIYVKQVSLFHYHSVVLTQTAINAAPKDFQIWGSFNLTKWYDLGNFSYNYYEKEDTQYFDVVDMVNENKKMQGNVVIDTTLDEAENGYILNHTSMVTNGVYDDYIMGFKFIAFRLLSNYGGSDYGCIYRLRVFGDIVS